MSNIPGKCSRCGAPINWEEGVKSVKCNFCGNINYSNTRISYVFKNQINQELGEKKLTSL